jgi:hypothetical protein
MRRALALAALAVGGLSGAAGAAPAPACAAAEYRQLDFWLGDWDVYDAGGASQAVARAHITRTLDGCVVHELYEQSDGVHGESFSIFDHSRRVWHQTWVTNRGRLLQIEGGMERERVVLTGRYQDDAGRALVIRGTWWPVPEGVREFAETSSDDGHSWQAAFDLTFRPHRD